MRELVSKGEIMKKRRSVLALLLVAALTVVLGGCQDGKDGKADSSDTTSSQVSTESTPTGEPVMGGSITVGIPQDIEDSLDPHKSVAAGTKEILFNIYEGLVKPDEEGNLNDAVAESHSISEDGKVYTFKLRNGVKFHDGTTVTAEDVKYSIERCAGINGDGTPLVEAFSNVDKVEIPDESTIDIYLKEADTEFLAYLTVAIVPEHVEIWKQIRSEQARSTMYHGPRRKTLSLKNSAITGIRKIRRIWTR